MMKMQHINIGAVVVLITLFLWLGAPFFFGEQAADAAGRIIMMYLLMLLSVLVVFRDEMPVIPFNAKSITIFIITGTITTIALVSMKAVLFLSSFEPIVALSFGFLYAFVKAFIEEVIFRWTLVRRFNPVIASLMFGGFHFGVLVVFGVPFTTLLVAIGFLSALGFAWYMLSSWYGKGSPIGLMASAGSHFGYNLVALGVI